MRFICSKTIAALVPLLLGACASIGGQAAADAPPVATPSAWTSADPAIKTAAVAPETLAAWWTQFDDPVLDGLLAESLRAAPDVRSAQAR